MVALAYMDNERLGNLIMRLDSTVHEEENGYWKLEYQQCLVMVVTDESHNRMRIIAPIVKAGDVGVEEMKTVLAANFDRALDARFAINGDFLWSAYIHPLRELSDQQFLDALKQVVTLVHNYGGSYSSGGLVFGSES